MISRVFLSFFALLLITPLSQAKVYKNVKVGHYRSSLDLSDYEGQSFLETMKDVIYPEFLEQSKNRRGGNHIKGVQNGEGVEVRLTQDVSTLHVKYKAHWESKAERSGRSFSAVGQGRRIAYVADASYKHYLRTLEEIVKGDVDEMARFYRAILMVINSSDPSGISDLRTKSKQVAADFVAIYIAEQYRRLTATEGEYLGRSHQWDDAVLQVTLVAALHGGQHRNNRKMFYEGRFTDKVYEQSACLYKDFDNRKRKSARKRSIRLYDYWQFTTRSECPGRSGVNLTRRDFEALGQAITGVLYDMDRSVVTLFSSPGRSTRNVFEKVTVRLLEGEDVGQLEAGSEDLVESLVDVLVYTRENANAITDQIAH